jgi:hypothetical protein
VNCRRARADAKFIRDSTCDTNAPMQKRDTRDRRVNLRLSDRLVSKVETAAKDQLRSLNSMFEVIVTEWAAKAAKQAAKIQNTARSKQS